MGIRSTCLTPLRFGLWLVFVCVWAVGCKTGGSSPGESVAGKEVAEYKGNKYVVEPIAADADTDSTAFLRQLAEQWVQDAALADRALAEMPELEARVNRQLEQTRLSLLAHFYVERLVEQQLDTVVGFEEVDQYYKANAQQFTSPTNLYQFYFVKTRHADTTPQLRERLASENPEDRRIIKEWANQYATDLRFTDEYSDEATYLGYQSEFPAYALLGIPPRSGVVVNAVFDSTNTKVLSFLYVRDVIRAGQPQPLASVAVQIRNIILSQRRIELHRKLRAQALQQALQSNDAHILVP